MNYPFNSSLFRKFRRVLSLTLVVLMTVSMLAGCSLFGKKSTPTEPEETGPMLELPGETEDVPETTEAPTEAPTEPPKENVAIVKEQLNVRSSPSTGSNVTTQLDAGEEVEVLRVEPVNEVNWAYIYSEANSVKGWVPTNMLDMSNVQSAAQDPSSTPAGNEAAANNANAEAENNAESSQGQTTASGNTKAVVTANELNIRKEASSNSDRVGGYVYGDRITITETSGSWGKTNKGWVSMDYVYVDGNNGKNRCSGTVSATQLTVRSGPGTTYDSVSTLAQGAKVDVLEQIKVGNTVWGAVKGGWVSMSYVNVTSGTALNPDTTNTTTNTSTNNGNTASLGTATVTSNGLYIRSGAGTNFGVVDALAKGASAEVLEKKEVNGSTWGRISSGWICLDYTTMK